MRLVSWPCTHLSVFTRYVTSAWLSKLLRVLAYRPLLWVPHSIAYRSWSPSSACSHVFLIFFRTWMIWCLWSGQTGKQSCTTLHPYTSTLKWTPWINSFSSSSHARNIYCALPHPLYIMTVNSTVEHPLLVHSSASLISIQITLSLLQDLSTWRTHIVAIICNSFLGYHLIWGQIKSLHSFCLFIFCLESNKISLPYIDDDDNLSSCMFFSLIIWKCLMNIHVSYLTLIRPVAVRVCRVYDLSPLGDCYQLITTLIHTH